MYRDEIELVINSGQKDFLAYSAFGDILEEEGHIEEATVYHYIGRNKKWPKQTYDVHRMFVGKPYIEKRYIFEKSNNPKDEYKLAPFIFCEIPFIFEHSIKTVFYTLENSLEYLKIALRRAYKKAGYENYIGL